uniref:DE-cadherin n=2 Tax=Cacopsylla melanoneura TaxID=428564 RepID=A0A8D8QW96_9HEMI
MKLNCKMRSIGVCIWTWYSLCLLAFGFEDTIFGALKSDDPPSHIHFSTSTAKFRHIRHSRANSMNGWSQMASTTSPLTIQDNHKPFFDDCFSYKPTVKEGEPSGTEVIQVHAKDIDPPSNGGTIRYRIMKAPSERAKFVVDEHTGMIKTIYALDRDDPEREKEIYITVIAEDNGIPQLSDACTMKITVEDINDNEPMFDRVSYEELVPEDLPVGREVMRISATDIDDGRNSIVQYELKANPSSDMQYFRIDPNTGIIYLARVIDKHPGYKFNMTAKASDQGEDPQSNNVGINIRVVESNKKAPEFIEYPTDSISIYENVAPYKDIIATLKAVSNTDEKAPIFNLVRGRTEQTNSKNTFILEIEGNVAKIRIGSQLDYETVSNYTLTVRIENKFKLAAETQIFVHLIDVNDNIPVFVSDDGSSLSHSVLENEPPGTPVMQVKAVDGDSSLQHNQITYELADNQDNFAIDKYTGLITTLKTFDREEKDVYHVKVIATDSSESANSMPGSKKHNQGQQVFRIDIADKNDHPPVFNQKTYEAENIPEDANNHRLVAQVKANDTDDASTIEYSIVDGNIGDAFKIEPTTGQIFVGGKLDYEKITNYTLRVRAFDGASEDFCTVLINVLNVNDNRPVFEDQDREITIQEESIPPGCIATFKAYDPDIANRSLPQHIKYFIPDHEELGLRIDQDGCLSLTKALDRDKPGIPSYQVRIGAQDEDGASTSQKEYFELVINLIDINDNPPYLDMPGPVVWRENQGPGTITTLSANDNDSEKNGAPFKFEMAPEASDDIRSKFSINGDLLKARTTFDREEKKSYIIPIAITDSGSPPMTGISNLTVIIGDVNDNPMEPGKSSIFVYNYKGEAPDTEVGRVYVQDPDDWDLPDKVFKWRAGAHRYFDLNSANGMITMRNGTHEGSYLLHFNVTEESASFKRHTVEATVNVTVKVIPEEAIDKSGSFRLSGITAEEFIEPNSKGISKATILRNHLSKLLNTSVDNVDVFTVLHSPHNLDMNQLDVRFSAHGSPYYAPERINMAISLHQGQIEQELGCEILMVNIDECLKEKNFCKESLSCINFLNKSNVPYAVYTNTTSFVGVNAVISPFCKCEFPKHFCYNGGTPVGETCVCPANFDGPRCEKVSIGFNGNGYALYPTLQSCADFTFSFDIRAYQPDGLVFYVGPTSYRSSMGVQDFMSMELHDGFPVLLVDYGTGTTRLDMQYSKLHDGNSHHIDIILSNTSIELQVDKCKLQQCLALKTPVGSNVLLNVNGPLQVGGTFLDLDKLGRQMNWDARPSVVPFSGCISNMTFNKKLYNLGFPSVQLNSEVDCGNVRTGAYTLGIDSSFLIAILICCAILLMLLLAVIVQRKKSDDNYKDTDDIRENIIDYEEEGGGEGDMTGFDLDVLRCTSMYGPNDAKLPNGHLIKGSGDEVPDICGFLDGKKHHVDNDPETNPFDDVRHYAYEGDGNTTGSLSSLASVTDEGDLNFDYLSNFGPRFRKLADMYGEDPSDEEDENYQPAASESWC